MLVTTLRTVIMYFFVIIGIRLMGKRQIGDMQPGELVVTLLISEIAAIPLQDSSQPMLLGITSIFTLAVLEIIVSVIAMKSFAVRKLLSGKSAVLIRNGQLDQNEMKRVRITIIDLIELLRAQDVYDLNTVAFAVLEVNGSLSVLLKAKDQPVTAGDMNLKKPPEGLPLPVISDGRIVTESLKVLGITRQKIEKIAQKNGARVEDIFLLSLDRYDNFKLIRKDKNDETT